MYIPHFQKPGVSDMSDMSSNVSDDSLADVSDSEDDAAKAKRVRSRLIGSGVRIFRFLNDFMYFACCKILEMLYKKTLIVQ